jgi:uracil phosphoribosyltransferase
MMFKKVAYPCLPVPRTNTKLQTSIQLLRFVGNSVLFPFSEFSEKKSIGSSIDKKKKKKKTCNFEMSSSEEAQVVECFAGPELEQLKTKYANLRVLRQTPRLIVLHTLIRDRQQDRSGFVFHMDRLIRLVIEEALTLLECEPVDVVTPTNCVFKGFKFAPKLCGVSIMRAGDSMVSGLRAVLNGVRIGKLLIQRNEESDEKEAKLYYAKLPADIEDRVVLLLDPMLASGGSVICAIDVLIRAGVPEQNVIFVNLMSCPEGIASLFEAYPKVRVVTSMIDRCLNDNKYLLPGVGDAGDRYFSGDSRNIVITADD